MSQIIHNTPFTFKNLDRTDVVNDPEDGDELYIEDDTGTIEGESDYLETDHLKSFGLEGEGLYENEEEEENKEEEEEEEGEEEEGEEGEEGEEEEEEEEEGEEE